MLGWSWAVLTVLAHKQKMKHAQCAQVHHHVIDTVSNAAVANASASASAARVHATAACG